MINEHPGVRYAGYRTRELGVDGDGPTIVLLHGFGHPADCWRPVLQRLGQAGRSAIAVDLPGFGHADDTRPGPGLPQLDAFVDGLVDHHGSSAPVVLVGNSLGALAALRAAGRRTPVAAVLATAAAGFGWTPAIRVGTMGDLRCVALLAEVPAPRAIRRPVVDAVARLLLYGRRTDADPDMIALVTAQLSNRTASRRLMRSAVAYAGEVSTRQRVGPIDCPVTLVHGRRDHIVSLTASRRLHISLPGSTLVVLDDAGHCPHLDAPDDIAAMAARLTTTDKESE
ncbi:alpha/beta hydrolase [Mycobacterium yunnanensis]|uniref:Alpha/beta hydrolase n=1 Tax=Mycobacterium yunnanensis TaxID=368477 RepID=A0A9X2Z923_9MYCO|nr:alpha/beta hydrolase [Mycobacterium yunnanensis]MCV7424769.1 alpha/beta hydrolase [Mycobacterium yunnanensis]